MNRGKGYLIVGGIAAAAVVGVSLSLSGIVANGDPQPASVTQAGNAAQPADQTAQAQGSVEPEEPPEILGHALDPWRGDFDGMVERGFVRILTAYNPLFFAYDGLERKGLVVDVAQEFEKYLAKVTGEKPGATNVVLIPVARDDLLPYLLEGKGDIVAANLTITPDRQKSVAFSDPTYPDVSELVVTGPAAPEIASLDDLATSEVHVRKSSSYFEHLAALNKDRAEAGEAEVPIVAADELLEDYDLLELVNAGLIPAVIVDSHKAALWAQVFKNIKVHEDLSVHSGGSIAWALRQDNPELAKVVNAFVKDLKKGTLLGNILIKRYLKNTDWIDNVRSGEAAKKYEATVEFIKKYAGEYDFDWLMIVAQGYQESKLDQNKKSAAGAIGVMQILPSTAADPNVGIPDIEKTAPNIHAGVKYLRFLKDRYFSTDDIDPLDRVLFAFAAYNAGPAKISKARKKAAEMGLDPTIWFGETEIAAAKTISREPVIYVRNIYKYYVAYRQAVEIQKGRSAVVEGQE
jgi:membrane-bound lytic murein transglycosylase MltF